MWLEHVCGLPVRPDLGFWSTGCGTPVSWSSEANVHSGSCDGLICPVSLARCQGGLSSHRLWAVARGAQRPQVRTHESQGGSAHSYVRNADVHPAWVGARDALYLLSIGPVLAGQARGPLEGEVSSSTLKQQESGGPHPLTHTACLPSARLLQIHPVRDEREAG